MMAAAVERAPYRETTEEIEKALVLLRSQGTALSTKIVEQRRKISALNQELVASVNTQRDVMRRITIMENRIFARTPLPPELIEMRNALLCDIQHSKDEMITSAARKMLLEKIEIGRRALQDLCAHPFVFSYDGYAGSSRQSFSDAEHGHRVCALCNRRETSRGNSADIYKLLKEDRSRLVRRDRRKETMLAHGYEWFQTDFIRQLFDDSAECCTITWPEKIEPFIRELHAISRRFIS